MPKFSLMVGSAFALVAAQPASAAQVYYTDLAAFQAALTEGWTLIDTSENLGKTVAELSAQTPGTTFFGAPSYVRSDGLILNGQGFFGPATPHVGMNFDVTVSGVGVWTNAFDGGRIKVYSGANATGSLIADVALGSPSNGSSNFAGVVLDEAIGSVVFTCDFNFDLSCGLIDPIFGSGPLANAVPEPASWAMLIAGLGIVGGALRRRPKVAFA